MTITHISWSGPISLKEIVNFKDSDKDFGVYQIYGSHHLYGNDVLLYIGKAVIQTFGDRIQQEHWDYTNDPNCIKIYLGRVIGEESEISENEWNLKIDLAEKLLIFAHTPVKNTSNLNSIPENDVQDVVVYNWGEYRQLFPEVSGLRWSSKFDDLADDAYYTMSKTRKKTKNV
jgi:hypothetical protein